jgi:hypothetical protein
MIDGSLVTMAWRVLSLQKRRHLSVLDFRSFRAADCDTDHHVVVAEVMERLAVNKQRLHRFHMERFKLKKQSDVQGQEQYRIEVPNRITALKVLVTVLGKLLENNISPKEGQ